MATEGWAQPLGAEKSHFFVDGQSLCGRWEYFAAVEPGRACDADCKACAKAARKRPIATQPEEQPRLEVLH